MRSNVQRILANEKDTFTDRKFEINFLLLTLLLILLLISAVMLRIFCLFPCQFSKLMAINRSMFVTVYFVTIFRLEREIF